jgi:hypothetical protein
MCVPPGSRRGREQGYMGKAKKERIYFLKKEAKNFCLFGSTFVDVRQLW